MFYTVNQKMSQIKVDSYLQLVYREQHKHITLYLAMMKPSINSNHGG